MTHRNNDGCTGHLLVAGVAALVASSVVALAGLSLAQDGSTSSQTSGATTTTGDTATTSDHPATSTAGDAGQWAGHPAPDGCDWSHIPQDSNCMRWDCKDGSFSCGERRLEGPQQGGQQWGSQDGDKCSQMHSYQGGDRCEKERMLLQYGCVPDISPECKGGGSGNQYGSGQQGGGKRVEVGPNGIATCYDEDGRWDQGPECQKAAGTYHEPGQSGQWGGQDRGPQRNSPYPMGGNIPGRSGPGGSQFGGVQMMPGMHGGPMGPGGFPGMGREGFGGGRMSCEQRDAIVEEMRDRLTEMDAETADRWSDMEESMRERAAEQIERLHDKIGDTDDAKKIEKYKKQIAKIEGKIEKQVTKMKARFEKQAAKMKARMEKEIAKLEDRECVDEEDMEGDFGGGEWDGGDFGGGQMAPSFSPGGGNPFGF